MEKFSQPADENGLNGHVLLPGLLKYPRVPKLQKSPHLFSKINSF